MDDVGSQNIRGRIQLNLPQNNHRGRTGSSGPCGPPWGAGHGSPLHREIPMDVSWRTPSVSSPAQRFLNVPHKPLGEPSVFFPSPVMTALNRRLNSTQLCS